MLVGRQLEPHDRGIPAVDRGAVLTGIARHVVEVGAREIRRNDVVLDVLVEQAGGVGRRGTTRVPGVHQVEVGRTVRVEVHVAGLVLAVFRLALDERRGITEVRSGNRLRGRRLEHAGVVELVAQVQARQDVDVALIVDHRRDGLVVVVVVDALTAVVSVFNTDATKHAQAIDIDRAHHVRGEHVLADTEVAGVRVLETLVLVDSPIAAVGVRVTLERRTDAWAKVVQRVADVVILELVEGDILKIRVALVIDVFPGVLVVVLVAHPGLGAELDEAGVVTELHVLLEVEGHGPFFVLGLVILEDHFLEREVFRVVHVGRTAYLELLALGIGTRLRTLVLHELSVDTPALFLSGGGVTKLVVDRPVVDAVLATDDRGEDRLGLVAELDVLAVLDAIAGDAGLRVQKAVIEGVFEGVLVTTARLGVLEITVERAQVVLVVVVRAEIDVEGQAGALAIDDVGALLGLFRESLAGRRIEDPAAVGLHVVRAELTVLVSRADGDTEVVLAATDAKDVGNRSTNTRAPFPAQVVVTAFQAGVAAEAVTVKGVEGLDLDVAADGITVHVWRDRLGDFQTFDQVGGDHVERDLAFVVLGRRHAHAVDRDGIEIGVQTTNGNETALALVSLQLQARQALQGLGRVLVREFTDFLGCHDRLDAGRGPLTVDRPRLTGQLTRDLDRVQVVRTQLKLSGNQAVFLDGDRLAGLTQTDIVHHQRVLAGRDVLELKTATGVGISLATGFHQTHARAFQGGVARCGTQLTPDGAVIGRGQCWDRYGGQGQRTCGGQTAVPQVVGIRHEKGSRFFLIV